MGFNKEASEAKLPLILPRVSVEDSPDLRRLMARLRRIIERAEADRTSTTTTTTTTATTTTPVLIVEIDDELTRKNITSLFEKKEMLCLKFAKKCLKLGTHDQNGKP